MAGADFIVEVIDSTSDYVDLMRMIFDFDKIKGYLHGKNVLLNAMNGGRHVFLKGKYLWMFNCNTINYYIFIYCHWWSPVSWCDLVLIIMFYIILILTNPETTGYMIKMLYSLLDTLFSDFLFFLFVFCFFQYFFFLFWDE